ncbi:MAG: hypothetical protein HFG48_01755, partial [Bacilli bacterium]|nr:hypothetical protein [Bacilli bacterium]
MDKEKLLDKIKNKEDKILISNLFDRYNKYCKNGIFLSSNFINESQELLLKKYLPKLEVYKINDLCTKSVVSFSKN